MNKKYIFLILLCTAISNFAAAQSLLYKNCEIFRPVEPICPVNGIIQLSNVIEDYQNIKSVTFNDKAIAFTLNKSVLSLTGFDKAFAIMNINCNNETYNFPIKNYNKAKYKTDNIICGLNADNNGKILFSIKEQSCQLFVFMNNKLITDKNVKQKSNLIEISIPDEFKAFERSWLRIYAVKNNVIFPEVLVALKNGKVITDAKDFERTDYESAIIYNVFIDRFCDGNPLNNKPLNIPQVNKRADWHGGDVKGVTDKITDEYFKNLNVNTLWISPVVKNPEKPYGYYPEANTTFTAYHGYWPISFNQTDNRLCTPEELKEFSMTAHKNNMNVLLDFVPHHVHNESAFYQKDTTNFTPLYLPDGTLNTERWDDQRLTTWFDTFLPTINLTKPENCEMISDSAVFWIKEYNLDGFRFDAAKHVPDCFWLMLTKKLKSEVIKPENRRIYQIGETYGSDSLINSYINSGEFDAQFDFNLYDATTKALAGENSEGFAKTAQEIKNSICAYGAHHLMGNITGNQDRGRFISYAGGSLKFDEDAKKAGWTRNITVGDSTVSYARSAMLFALTASLPGIPVVYYGDEIGLAGGNDPDCRRMMIFENLSQNQKNLHDIVAEIFEIRKNNIAQILGNTDILFADKSTIAVARTYFSNTVITVINNSKSNISIAVDIPQGCEKKSLKSNFNNGSASIASTKIKLNIKACSFDIFTN